MKKLCRETFEVHSWYRWGWNGKVYARQCSLMGCDASQEAPQVRPVNKRRFVLDDEEPVYVPGKEVACKLHAWGTWVLIEEFWVKNNLYHVRSCSVCDAQQYAHDLVATEKPRILAGQDDGSW